MLQCDEAPAELSFFRSGVWADDFPDGFGLAEDGGGGAGVCAGGEGIAEAFHGHGEAGNWLGRRIGGEDQFTVPGAEV